MHFKNVIGQTDVKRGLVDLVQNNRLSHALLFAGKEGSGALPMAIAFAQYLLCENRQQPVERAEGGGGRDHTVAMPTNGSVPDSCGVCPACVKTQKLAHPDLHFSYPVIPKKSGDKPVSGDYAPEWREFISQYPYGNAFDWLQFIGAENKQGNITAHECADIIRKLSLKSFESGYKILIMWMPEYLGNEGNKLLKLIEEPPPDTLFLLVAENDSLLLPTILSRVQMVKIPMLEPEDIEKALIERGGAPPEQARQIAVISEGNYREAGQLIRHAEDDWEGLLREWLNAILKTGPVAQVNWIEEMSKLGRERQKQFLRYFSHLLEQAIRLRFMDPARLHIPDKEKDMALRLNKIADISCQKAIVEELDRAAYYIERNAHGKMLFHALTIKVYHILAEGKVAVVD
jgi:DNA polymerase III subunit delta'